MEITKLTISKWPYTSLEIKLTKIRKIVIHVIEAGVMHVKEHVLVNFQCLFHAR